MKVFRLPLRLTAIACGLTWVTMAASASAQSADRLDAMQALWPNGGRTLGTMTFNIRTRDGLTEFWRCFQCEFPVYELVMTLYDKEQRFSGRGDFEIAALLERECTAPDCALTQSRTAGAVTLRTTELPPWAGFIRWTVLFEREVLIVDLGVIVEPNPGMTPELIEAFQDNADQVLEMVIGPIADPNAAGTDQ